MQKVLIIAVLIATVLFASCGGKGGYSSLPSGAAGDDAFKLTMLADDGKTVVPLGSSFRMDADGLTVRVIATDVRGLTRSYFRLAYPPDRLNPVEAKPGILLPPADNVALCYTGNPGEVILGFATISGRPAVSGSGTLFEVTFTNAPYDASRNASAAPDGSQNRVDDLVVSPVNNNSYHLDWTEKNVGDYNVDGDVNVADITPVASNFGARNNDGYNDSREIPIDGDGDHTIGISDITPLAMNYGNHLDGYMVYRREGIYNSFAPVSSLVQRELNNGDGVLPTYAWDDLAPPTGVYISYEVRPVDNRGSTPEEGTGSTAHAIEASALPSLMTSIIGTDPTAMGNEELAQIFETYLFLFGGAQIGVVDSTDTELSNNVVPAEALMSLRHDGAIQLAQMWQVQATVQPYTLGEVLQAFVDEMVWDSNPTVDELIALQQQAVDDAWANLMTDPSGWAIVLQFNQGTEFNTTAPTLTAETQLNTFQAWALTVSFVRWADNEGKATSAYENILTFYPNMPGTFNDAGSLPTRLYNQWSSTSFSRRVLHAGIGAGATAGMSLLLGNPVSLPVVAGVAVFSFFVKPVLGVIYDIGNNAISDFSTPIMQSATVDTEPIPDTEPPQHIVHITWSTSIPMGGDGGPSFEIIRSESADGPWEVVARTHNSVSGVYFNDTVDNGGGSYTDYETKAISGKTYIYKVQRRDMRWGPDNVVMSGNSITVQVPAGPTVIGLVHDTNGTPLPNINVATSDGTKTWTDRTDGEGHFKLVDIRAGQRVISFSARGFATHLEQALVSTTVTALDITLPVYVGDVTARPVIDPFEYYQSEADVTAGLADIDGTVMNLDGPKVCLVQNGQEVLFDVDDYGNFTYRAVLVPGLNKFKLRAVNALGETVSNELQIMFNASFVFRATLTWNQGNGSDIDLYTKDPSGDVSYYSNKGINSGSLDVDNTQGYGPENFTCNWDSGTGSPEAGSYQIGVNYFDDDLEDPYSDPPVPARTVSCGIRLVLNPQTPQEQTLFYSGSVNVTNGGADWFGGGGSWWNPVVINVDASGVASVG